MSCAVTYVGVETVGHQLKLAVGGDEGDGAVVLKARQTDTLVELHVFQLHRFTLPPWRERRESGLAVESGGSERERSNREKQDNK